MDYDLLLQDRIEVIKTLNKKSDLEHNSYISFSGGKDSTILHYLIDMALPNNKIPRVFINTGIEYNYIVDFVKDLASKDDRFIIITPKVPIKQMLEKYGYPFKSKDHSLKVYYYHKGEPTKKILNYKNGNSNFTCPNILKYQFEDNFNLHISNKCCYKLKKEPVAKWMKENKKPITITGMRKTEGGLRATSIKGCILTDKNKNVVKFHPLFVVDNYFEERFIKENNIRLCKLYYEPFNFTRTGCKGCPYALDLQNNLTIMERYLPIERRQCEIIWAPIYKEYRRLNYRLKRNEQLKLF